jgi:hypothetical protein
LSYYVVARKKESLPQHFRHFHDAIDDRRKCRKQSGSVAAFESGPEPERLKKAAAF